VNKHPQYEAFTNKLSFALILVALVLNSSCLNRQFIEGRSELVSISDSILNDSSIFVGHVQELDFSGNYPYKAIPFEVWIENTKYSTMTDSIGNYSLKTLPGTYTLRCQTKSNEWEKLIEEKRNIKIDKNTKIQIDFYIGYTIE
jgi:hypothetical protein